MHRLRIASHIAAILLLTTTITLAQEQNEHVFESQLGSIEYLLYLPEGYAEDTDVEWPLIFYHHGSGVNGAPLSSLKFEGMPARIEDAPDLPFIVLSPALPFALGNEIVMLNFELVAGNTVDMGSIRPTLDALMALLGEVTHRYRVDVTRMYATGLSQGGYVTWFLGAMYPGRFAALAPLAGGGDPTSACLLKNTPVWVFHGAKDTTIPLTEAEEMITAIELCGGNQVRHTFYPEWGHSTLISETAYAGNELYDWFLGHQVVAVESAGRLPVVWAMLKHK